jgi:hypothetical protein
LLTLLNGHEKKDLNRAVIDLVEKELDFRVLYCVGEEEGSQAGLVSLGVASRKSLAGAIETAQRWRAYKLVTHFQYIIMGEGRLLRLKAELESSWRSSWVRASWWEKSGQAAALNVVALAAQERIQLLTEDEATNMETEARERKRAELMARTAGV